MMAGTKNTWLAPFTKVYGWHQNLWVAQTSHLGGTNVAPNVRWMAPFTRWMATFMDAKF